MGYFRRHQDETHPRPRRILEEERFPIWRRGSPRGPDSGFTVMNGRLSDAASDKDKGDYLSPVTAAVVHCFDRAAGFVRATLCRKIDWTVLVFSISASGIQKVCFGKVIF